MLTKMASLKFLTPSLSILGIFLLNLINPTISEFDEELTSEVHIIEGKVFPPENLLPENWQLTTKVLVNGGEFIAFLKEDGTFAINNVPSGTYVVEIYNPNYSYEPIRVDINSKGKFRARKVNYIQQNQVIQVPYPLKFKSQGKIRYFSPREQWRITDFLFSPMVLMMVLPLILIMVLPKMMNDPETKKEMEQLNNFKYELPEFSEMLTSYLSGGEKTKKAIKAKKRQ